MRKGLTAHEYLVMEVLFKSPYGVFKKKCTCSYPKFVVFNKTIDMTPLCVNSPSWF